MISTPEKQFAILEFACRAAMSAGGVTSGRGNFVKAFSVVPVRWEVAAKKAALKTLVIRDMRPGQHNAFCAFTKTPRESSG